MSKVGQAEAEARGGRSSTGSRLLHILLGANKPETDPIETPKRPPQLIYSIEELPPIADALVLGLQHVFVMSVGWVFVVVLVAGIGGTPAQAQSIIRISMIASGIATILQARTNSKIGSGYLCPFSCGPAYLGASILAGKTGGLPLIFGLTVTAGLFEGVLSRLLRYLRVLFPPEVTGLVVSMVGIELVGLGCPRFLGYTGEQIDKRATIIACLTLAAMIGPTVWGKGRLRLYPIVLGLATGYTASAALGARAGIQLFVPLSHTPAFVTGSV